jgi:DNA-binding IclR family transcriptional regulator
MEANDTSTSGRVPATAERDGGADRQYLVKSLQRGLGLLTLFDREHPHWTLSEIVRATGIHKATCYRLLRTLEASGFLTSDVVSGRFGLGPSLTRIAILAWSTDELLRGAQPHVERLVEITGETVDLTVWSDAGPLLVSQVLSRNRLFQPVNSVGTVFTEAPSCHVKLWLAYGTATQTKRLRGMLTADRQGAPPDMAAIDASLDLVRRDGVALDAAAGREVFAVGAPVLDASDHMVAAITVVSSYALTGDTERELSTAAVRQVAREFSLQLGHSA